MLRIIWLTWVLLLLLALTGTGAPINNDVVETKKYDLATPWVKTLAFRGGERACVMAVGIRRGESSPLQITVHDKNDVLVAEDKGSGLAGDCVATIWYPPRDGEYRVTVSSPDPGGACLITVK